MWRRRLGIAFGAVGAGWPLLQLAMGGDAVSTTFARRVLDLVVGVTVLAAVGGLLGSSIDKTNPRNVREHPRPAGWYRDPFRRFYVRYWDGFQWTTSVRHFDGVDQIDNRPETG